MKMKNVVIVCIVCVFPLMFAMDFIYADGGSLSSGISAGEPKNSNARNTPGSVNTPQANPPKIEFAEAVHDFGEQMSETHLNCIFSFKNKGAGALIIEKVTAG
jgi:hypothetical protein